MTVPSAAGDPAVLATSLTITSPEGRALLDELTLRIESGERVLIVGPSGSGKSTLLQAIAGLPPTGELEFSGSLRVGGVEVAGRSMSQAPRDTGWLPQDPAAAVCLPTVEDDVAFPCENREIAPERIGPLIDAALRRSAVIQLRTADTATLSDGQAQRVGLAVATVTDPSILVLDEPTSMLDPLGVLAVHRAVHALRGVNSSEHSASRTNSANSANSANGARDHHRNHAGHRPPTLLLVEHRLDDLAGAIGFRELPERTLLLLSGRLVADGPTAEVLIDGADLLRRNGCWLPWEAEHRSRPGPAPALTRSHPPTRPASAAAGATRAGRAPTELLLRTENLAVGYRAPLLTNIDLRLHGGELVAVVGANGAGKSTLLRVLAGLRKPVGGSVLRPAGRPGLVFQNPEHQFVAPTVRRELGWDGADPDTVQRALRRHRLEHVGDLSPFRLSGGEKRRLSLATILIGDRRLLLADEPMFGLDRGDTLQVNQALREATGQGRAVLFSCHDLRVVAELADRLLVVADGRIVADGPTLPLLRDPDLRAAAGLRLPPALQALFADSDDTRVRQSLEPAR